MHSLRRILKNQRPIGGDLLIKKCDGTVVMTFLILESFEYNVMFGTGTIDFSFNGVRFEPGKTPVRGHQSVREYATSDSSSPVVEYELIEGKHHETIHD